MGEVEEGDEFPDRLCEEFLEGVCGSHLLREGVLDCCLRCLCCCSPLALLCLCLQLLPQLLQLLSMLLLQL